MLCNKKKSWQFHSTCQRQLYKWGYNSTLANKKQKILLWWGWMASRKHFAPQIIDTKTEMSFLIVDSVV